MKAICFDMDGVLIQSESHWTKKQREEILPNVTEEDTIPLSVLTGRNFRELYPELDDQYDVVISREEFERLFEQAGEDIYRRKASLLDGAHELLDDMKQNGVSLALTTSAPLDWISVIDDRFQLLRHFDAVVSAEQLAGPGKPAPDIYLRGASELAVSPDECVAVEDSQAGVRAANAAGMQTIGFRGDGDPTALTDTDALATDIEELRELLNES